MGYKILQSPGLLRHVPEPLNAPSIAGRAWELAARQHGVVARWQLLALGLSTEAIKHRLAKRRLHRLARGVYAVGRAGVTREGELMAAVLACGPEAFLSHFGALELAGAWRAVRPTHVSVPADVVRKRKGLVVHRRSVEIIERVIVLQGIPLIEPVVACVEVAPSLSNRQIERLINEGDALDLFTPHALRDELARHPGRPGVPRVRALLGRHSFALTETELEAMFLPLARRAGLAEPETQARVNGYRVDFYWPGLGLVVEADSLRYHRTAAKQTADHRRDQAHAAAGLTPLRFTHFQIAYEPDEVVAVLRRVAGRLRATDEGS